MSYSFNKRNEQVTSYRVYVLMDGELYDYYDFLTSNEVSNFIDTFVCKHPEEEKTFNVVKRIHYKDIKVKGEKI